MTGRDLSPEEQHRFRYLNAAIPRVSLPYYHPDHSNTRWEHESPVDDHTFDTLCSELRRWERLRGGATSASPLTKVGWGAHELKAWLDLHPEIRLKPFALE